MRAPLEHIFHHTPESLREWFEVRRLPHFRARQVLEWVYRKGVIDPARMTNLGLREREMLARELVFESGEIVRSQASGDGTMKLLVEWGEFGGEGVGGPSDKGTQRRSDEKGAHGDDADGLSLPLHPAMGVRSAASGARAPAIGAHADRRTECVMIPSQDPTKVRRTACVSSQVGCPVGCRFCASGLGGLDGNLTAGRIVEQVWLLNHALGRSGGGATGGPGDEGARITNIVFMGMGEPLANFANVLHAVRTLAAPWGLGISARRITISTVGLPRAIEKLAEQLELPVTLALSLHAPNDALRRELIPWAQHSTIPELLTACGAWFEKTGREITLEYILLGGVNDRPAHARELASLARTLRANINLIRYNEVEPLAFVRPRSEDVLEFQRILRSRGVNAHIRASRGRDIAAACGQLRHESSGA